MRPPERQATSARRGPPNVTASAVGESDGQRAAKSNTQRPKGADETNSERQQQQRRDQAGAGAASNSESRPGPRGAERTPQCGTRVKGASDGQSKAQSRAPPNDQRKQMRPRTGSRKERAAKQERQRADLRGESETWEWGHRHHERRRSIPAGETGSPISRRCTRRTSRLAGRACSHSEGSERSSERGGMSRPSAHEAQS